MLFSDSGYWIKAYSNIQYNVGHCTLQSDIGGSDIRLCPITNLRYLNLSKIKNFSILLFKIDSIKEYEKTQEKYFLRTEKLYFLPRQSFLSRP
jgi:HJR/Mrr/RecB family endonuclease